MGIEGSNGSQLVLTQEAAVTFHICTQDGGEFPFNFLGGHGVLFSGFTNGRIKTTFYETLVLEWFAGPQGGKNLSEASY